MSLSVLLESPNIPSPPALALRIVEAASKPNCDTAEVLSLLNKDSGLSSQVLKTVNSGLFGLSKPVGSLKQAVVMLGVRPLRSLVLSLALPAIQIPDRDEFVLRYWQESVAGAVIVRELAVLLRRKDPEDDLIAGLLRDIGVLVLRDAFGEQYRTLWKGNPLWARRQCDVEREALGVDHADVSAGILESWNLPADIHQPIRYHHSPYAYTDAPRELEERAWMLYFANKVATLNSTSPASISELLQFAKKQFGLDQNALIKFLATVTPLVSEFASLLKVDIGQCPNYSAVIAAGCQELVRLTLESSMNVKPKGGSSRPELKATDVDADMTQAHGAPILAAPSEGRTIPDFELSFMNQVPENGAWLNGYEVKSILGRGAMGVVFKALDPSLKRFAAIKMMTPERVIQAEARDWFMREARAAAAIQHENVVTIYAVSEMNCLPYLVMEYLDGTSLQERLDEVGPLPIADVVRFGRQVAAGLGAAHARGVIHRDIKPANILFVRETNTVKITDFGLARVVDDSKSSPDGFWVGTPQYMSPEQFNTSDVDARADLFSLGSMLYKLCTGRTPFKGESVNELAHQIRTATPASLHMVRPDAPAWLGKLIAKLHSKQPILRHQSAAEVVSDFDRNAK
jgi:eukaryotic-like serine/threonine-protein kinase